MSDISANNKRIAKNTIALYVRMLFSMCVKLYTSRVVLNTLGVVDYGISGVVGGVVAMFSFLNTSMASATSRFLTFEIGSGTPDKLRDTFSCAFWLHAIIAFIILILSETIGLWFVANKLVIPTERMFAAHCIYQLSILSMIISILQVPYSALIMSREKMGIYAGIEILHVSLKLIIVFLLLWFNFDKLILYGILLTLITIFISIIYRIYCHLHFNESRIRFVWRPDIMRPMMSFSGWDLYGNMSVIARTQGVNILLNMFFGPIMNAAATVATQVQGAIMTFAANVLTAVRPQIIKQYAQGNKEHMIALIRNATKINFLLLLFISIPVMAEMDFILDIWLVDVPKHAATFCIYTLLFNFFASMSSVIVTGVHATGNIKRPSLINGTLYLLVIPISYLSFKCGGEAWISYLFNVIAVFIGMLSNAYTLHLYVKEFPLHKFVLSDLLRCLAVLLIVSISMYFVKVIMTEGWLRLFISLTVSTTVLSILGYLILLPKSVKEKIVSTIRKKICKKD